MTDVFLPANSEVWRKGQMESYLRFFCNNKTSLEMFMVIHHFSLKVTAPCDSLRIKFHDHNIMHLYLETQMFLKESTIFVS